MEVLYAHCAGLDIHKKTVVACRVTRDASGLGSPHLFEDDLLALSDWLQGGDCTHGAMQSTGDYWKPVYNLLEGSFELLVVNARHIKTVPGRKPDVKDAEWIAQLLEHGLLRPRFVPPPPQRERRELTRLRTNFVRERAMLVNQVQKVLESGNIKLASVATDVLGASGRALLRALIAGERDAAPLSDLAKGRLRLKQDLLAHSLEGNLRSHHRLILRELRTPIENLEASIQRLGVAIEESCRPFEDEQELLRSIPGVARRR